MAPNPMDYIGSSATMISHTGILQFKSFGSRSKHPETVSKIDRNRFMPVCGHRPGHLWLGFVWFWGSIGAQQSTISGRILKSCRGLIILCVLLFCATQ